MTNVIKADVYEEVRSSLPRGPSDEETATARGLFHNGKRVVDLSPVTVANVSPGTIIRPLLPVILGLSRRRRRPPLFIRRSVLIILSRRAIFPFRSIGVHVFNH